MKNILTLKCAMAIILASLIVMVACKKEEPEPTPTPPDTAVPVITLNDSTNRVEQFSSATYTDPGATAVDAHDGTVNVTVAGSVNMNLANIYTLTYTASDSAGNTATETREVTVDGALYLAGTYAVTDYVGTALQGTYIETISSITTTYNRINFSKFAFYQNAAVYATISGTTITVPTQTVLCGLPPSEMNHTFSGTGTYTSASTFTINYTDISTNGTFTCHGDYVMN